MCTDACGLLAPFDIMSLDIEDRAYNGIYLDEDYWTEVLEGRY